MTTRSRSLSSPLLVAWLLLSLIWIGLVLFAAFGTGTLSVEALATLVSAAPPSDAGVAGEVAGLAHTISRAATLQTLALIAVVALGPPLATLLVLRLQIRRAAR